MPWFIINAVIDFGTSGQFLLFPQGGVKGRKYVMDVKTPAEIAYWKDRLAQAKDNGATGIRIEAEFSVSEKGYPNKKEIPTKNGVIPVGAQITHYVKLTGVIKADNVTDHYKSASVSTIPTDDDNTVSTIPS